LPKILIIDDDSDIRDLISCILEMEGYIVVVAEDGIKGVAQYRAELPDLVITDMVMPRQGGVETIIKIRQETPWARIIAVSGGGRLDETHPLVAAEKLGAMATLYKPFSMTELIDCAARALAQEPMHTNQHLPAMSAQGSEVTRRAK
jgi:two-component system chemotaxis response regulator CheY